MSPLGAWGCFQSSTLSLFGGRRKGIPVHAHHFAAAPPAKTRGPPPPMAEQPLAAGALKLNDSSNNHLVAIADGEKYRDPEQELTDDDDARPAPLKSGREGDGAPSSSGVATPPTIASEEETTTTLSPVVRPTARPPRIPIAREAERGQGKKQVITGAAVGSSARELFGLGSSHFGFGRSSGDGGSSTSSMSSHGSARLKAQPSKTQLVRRNSAGSMPAPSLSGRLAIAPRWSIDPAPKHVQPPPPPTPPSMRKRKSGSSGSGRKNSVGERAAKVRGADMKEDLQQAAMDCASDAIDQFDGEKEIAEYIKKEFDKKHGSTWHCIVGRNFGSYVTHEAEHFVYLSQGKVAVLLFKAG